MADKKPKKFGDKAKKRFGSNAVSVTSILSDEETAIPQSNETAKPQKHDTVGRGTPKAEEQASDIIEEAPKVEHTERHFFYFTEELTDSILDFMRQVKPREKNKNRFMRVLLNDFFSKTPEQQERLYKAALKKFEDIV